MAGFASVRRNQYVHVGGAGGQTSTNGSCTVTSNIVTCIAPALRVAGNADITITSTQPSAGNFAFSAAVAASR